MLDRRWLVALSLVAAAGCASAASVPDDPVDDPDAGDTGGAAGSGDPGLGGSGVSGVGVGGSSAGFPGSNVGGKGAAGPGGSTAKGGTGNSGGSGTGNNGGSGTGNSGGSGTGNSGGSGTGNSGGSSGSAGSTMACGMATNSCPAATSLGTVSGDTGGSTVMGMGTSSEWFSVRVTEDDNGVLGTKLRLKAVLTSPATANYDLFAYVNGGADQVSCSAPTGQSTNASGQDAVDLKWGEGSVANGADDSRTVSIEVRWVSGGCEPFTLKATGNNLPAAQRMISCRPA